MDLHCKIVLFEVSLESSRRNDKAARHAKTQLQNPIEVMRFAADEIEQRCLIERNYIAGVLQRRHGSEERRCHAARPLTPIRKSHQLNNKWIDGPRMSTHSHVVHGVCTATVTAASIPTIEST